jgi:GNAT superfamily N-acetyltransferase
LLDTLGPAYGHLHPLISRGRLAERDALTGLGSKPKVGRGGTNVKARVAGSADISAVASTLVEAFFLDPVWGWAFSDPLQRKAQHFAWFHLLIGSAIEHQWVWMTPAYEAVSVWVPPGYPELSEADEARLRVMLEDLVRERFELLMEVFDCFEAAHPRTRAHYYLSLLGTHTDHRGSGIGMGLLAANLARIDAVNMPAYLESTNPGNIQRYESVGFEVFETFDLPDDGPTVTTMWREPSAQVT